VFREECLEKRQVLPEVELSRHKLLKLKVIRIEPEIHWDRSRSAYKAVMLENGMRVLAAPEAMVGDEVFIHPETGHYLYKSGDRLRPRKGWPWTLRRIKVRVRSFFDFLFISFVFPGVISRLIKARTIHGEVTVAEAAFLILAAEDPSFGQGNIVEIGTFQGLSTACLAQGNRKFPNNDGHKVIAIDPHYHDTLPIFLKNMKRLGLQEDVTTLISPSAEVACHHQDPVRILWIDGHHEYEFVKQDIELWEPYLIEGGLMLLHDTGRPGVDRCIDELIRRSGNYHSIGVFNGITYAVKGDNRQHSFLSKMERVYQIRNKFVRFAAFLGLGVERSSMLATRLALTRENKKNGHLKVHQFLSLPLLSLASLLFISLVLELVLRISPPPDLAFTMEGRRFKQWAYEHALAESVPTEYGAMKRLKRNVSMHVDYPGVSSYDVYTGDEGFRTLNIDETKRKIFTIGDSLTFGYWVNEEESWPALVNARLQSKNPQIQVANLATPGHSTFDQFAILKEMVPKYRPDWVVVGFSVGNDYYDNYKDRELGIKLGIDVSSAESVTAKDNSFLQRIFDSQYQSSFREWIKLRSYLFNFVWLRLTPTGVAQNYWTFSYPHNPKFLKGVELTRLAFQRLNKFLKSYDCRLLVVILPTKEQIDFERYEEDYAKRRWRASLIGYHFPPREELPFYSRLLSEILDEQGTPHIDLHDAFLARKSEKLFFPNDFHPSRAGYRLIADAVGDYFEKNL